MHAGVIWKLVWQNPGAKHALSVVQLLSYKHINEKMSRLSGVFLSSLKKKNVKK